MSLACVRCDILEIDGPYWIRMDDPKLKPMLEAAARSNRETYGFSPLPVTGDVHVEEAEVKEDGYDVMLHLSRGHVSRTVDFVREGTGYRWIGEQEVHEGPRVVEGIDGNYREIISMTFSDRSRSGVSQGLYINYHGPDSSLRMRNRLTHEDLRRTLEAWASQPYEPWR